MTDCTRRKLDPFRKLMLRNIGWIALAASIALAVPKSYSQTNAAQTPANSQAGLQTGSQADSKADLKAGNAGATAPAFDVAAIRQNNSDHTARSHIYYSPDDGSFRAINVPLKMLLQFAFGLPETRILGGPDWLNSTKFDVEAKADSAVDAQMHALSSDEGKLRKQKMVQALLADRFKLTNHMETRELPIYALVVAKGGSKLQQSKSNGTTIDSWNGKIDVRGGDNTIALLSAELAKKLGRVVVDKTGIQGRFDVTLNWTPDEGAVSGFNGSASASPGADSGPSIFTAIQEQLGLKLESQKGPVEVLVIDHIETPTEN